MNSESLKVLKVLLKLDGATIQNCELDGCTHLSEEKLEEQSSHHLLRANSGTTKEFYFIPCRKHYNNVWFDCAPKSAIVMEITEENYEKR